VPRDGDPPDLDGPRIRLLINEQPQMLTMPAQRALISAASLMREGFEEEAVNKIAYDYLTIAGFFERSKVDARPVAKWRDWQTLAIFTNVPDTNPVSLHWIEKPDVPATFTPADPDGLPVVPVVEASQPDLSPDGKA